MFLAEADSERVCVCVCVDYSADHRITVGQGGQTHKHTVDVNKKIVSSQKSNPLASWSYMCHLTHVSQLVTQDKDPGSVYLKV